MQQHAMKARIVFTLFLLALGLGALWDAHDTLAAQTPSHVITKGLAQLDWSHNEDRDALGVGQWYAWGMNSCGADYAHCVPMNRNWDMAAQTFCPPMELLGNEPTNGEPAGHPIAASVAASVTVAIQAACPNTQLVAANIHIANYNPADGTIGVDAGPWLAAYYAAYHTLTGHDYGGTNLIGLHCYQYAATCLSLLRTIEALPGYGGHYWITETGFPAYINSTDWPALLAVYALDPRIDRVYGWTNRGDCCDGMTMVNADGSLTAYGQAFKDWSGVAYSSYLPNVGGAQGYP